MARRSTGRLLTWSCFRNKASTYTKRWKRGQTLWRHPLIILYVSTVCLSVCLSVSLHLSVSVSLFTCRHYLLEILTNTFQRMKQRNQYQVSQLSHPCGHVRQPTASNVNSGRPQLRSAHANVLTVPRTNTQLGDRSFSVAGPRIWNSLPASLRQPDIAFGHFKRLLKAFLFGKTAAH